MANTLSTLVVRLAADVAQFSSDMGKAVHIAERQAKKIGDAFSTLGRIGSAAIAGISLQEIVTRTADAERSVSRLNTALKTTGFSAGVTASEIEDMAEALKKSTPFDDDEIRKGIASLLRFRDIQGDVFRQAVQLAPDLAAALDTDVISAYQRMGRALQDPLTGMRGLRDAGVRLSEQQIELVKRFQATGDIVSAQKVAIDAMRNAFGGAAGGENTGLTKSLSDVSKAYDDLLKTIGKTAGFHGGVQSFYGFLEQSLKDIETIVNRGDWVEKLLATAAFAAGFRGFNLSEPQQQQSSRPITGPGRDENLIARIGSLQRDIERAQEQAAKKAQEAQERSIVIGKANAEALLEVERDLAKQRQSILDEFNSQGLVSVSQYYEQRRSIVEQRLAAELDANRKAQRAQAIAFQQASERGEFEKRVQAEAQLIKLSFDRERIQRDASTELNMLWLQEREAAKKLSDQIEDINIQLQELQGNTVSAAAARFGKQTRELRNAIEKELQNTNLSPERRSELERGLTNIGLTKDLVVVTAQLNKVQEDRGYITQRLQIEEERIQNARRVGSISELEALARTSELRQEAVRQMEAQALALEAIADASRDANGQPLQSLVLQAQRARAELERLRAESDLVGEKFKKIFGDAFTDAFSDFLDGTKSAKEAFNDFAKSVLRDINRLIAEDLKNKLFESLGFGRGAGQGGGVSIFGELGRIFTGGSAGGSTPGINGGRLSDKDIQRMLESIGVTPTIPWGSIKPGAGVLQGPTQDGGNLSDSALGKVFNTTATSAAAVDTSMAALAASVTTTDAGLVTMAGSVTTADAGLAAMASSVATTDAMLATLSATSPTVDAALASLAAAAEAAAAALSTVGTSGSGGGGVGGILGMFGGGSGGIGGASTAADVAMIPNFEALAISGYMANGSEYVPHDGAYYLHQGEAVVPAAENRGRRSMTFSPVFQISGPVDRRSLSQIEVAAMQGAQRALARDA